MAGLACAVKASGFWRVILYEASPVAGGRCRSFDDPNLDQTVDNGSHLMLGAYRQTKAYIKVIGGDGGLKEYSPATFPFHDLETGISWSLRMNQGAIPFWLFIKDRRAPNSRPVDYIRDALSLRRATRTQTVTEVLGASRLFSTLWEPFTLAVLNTRAESASAILLWAAVVRTFLGGEKACRPLLARHNLGDTLITPALECLKKRGVDVHYSTSIKALKTVDDRVISLTSSRGDVAVNPADQVIIATPPEMSKSLLPTLTTPQSHNVIINIHFSMKGRQLPLPLSLPFLGLSGSTTHWLFQGEDLLSATISDAQSLTTTPAHEIAEKVWGEVIRATKPTNDSLPPFRVIKEKRATFAQMPDENKRRPKTTTRYENLFLAGDWTDTGLPATIEGAIQSGFDAAALCGKRLK